MTFYSRLFNPKVFLQNFFTRGARITLITSVRRGDILQFSEIEFLVRSNNQKRDSCTKTKFRPENSEKKKIRGGGAELSNIVFFNVVISKFCDTKILFSDESIG